MHNISTLKLQHIWPTIELSFGRANQRAELKDISFCSNSGALKKENDTHGTHLANNRITRNGNSKFLACTIHMSTLPSKHFKYVMNSLTKQPMKQEKLQMVLHKHVALKHQGQLTEHVNEVE